MDETRLAEHMGRLDGEQRAMKADVAELKRDMKALLAAVNQARGGWKTILIVAGVSGAAGALMSKAGALVAWMPKIG